MRPHVAVCHRGSIEPAVTLCTTRCTVCSEMRDGSCVRTPEPVSAFMYVHGLYTPDASSVTLSRFVLFGVYVKPVPYGSIPGALL